MKSMKLIFCSYLKQKKINKINSGLILIFYIIFSNCNIFAQNNESVWIPGDTSNFSLLRGLIKDQDFFIKLNPNNSVPYMRKGVYKLRMNNLNGSIEDFKQAIKLEKDSHLIANMYAWMGGNEDRLGRFEEAKISFTNAIKIGGKFKTPNQNVNIPELDMVIDISFQYYNRGIINNRLKQFEDAISDFNNSIKINANWAEPFFGLGLANEYQNILDVAIKYYDEAIKIDPNFVQAYNNMANIYNQQKQYDLAIKHLETAIKINPKYTNAWMNIAESKYQKRDKTGACNAFKEYINLLKGNRESKQKEELNKKYCD